MVVVVVTKAVQEKKVVDGYGAKDLSEGMKFEGRCELKSREQVHTGLSAPQAATLQSSVKRRAWSDATSFRRHHVFTFTCHRRA